MIPLASMQRTILWSCCRQFSQQQFQLAALMMGLLVPKHVAAIYDPQHLENKKTDVYPPANDHISPVARQVQKWCSFSSGGKNVSSLEGVIGIFLMPRRFGERPQATVPSCYLDECQQLFLWKKGFRLDGFFGKGTFTQKKAICINLFIWNFKLVSLSSQPNGSQLGSHSGQSLIFRYNKV